VAHNGWVQSRRSTQVAPAAPAVAAHGLRAAARVGLGRENEANDEAVEAERLREDEDEDHADVELALLRVGAHARVANDANRNAGREPTQAAGKASRKVGEAGEGRVLRLAVGRRSGACGRGGKE